MTTWSTRSGAREAKRPARDRATIATHAPKAATIDRPSVSSTIPYRGNKKDGTKRLSRNRKLTSFRGDGFFTFC